MAWDREMHARDPFPSGSPAYAYFALLVWDGWGGGRTREGHSGHTRGKVV